MVPALLRCRVVKWLNPPTFAKLSVVVQTCHSST